MRTVIAVTCAMVAAAASSAPTVAQAPERAPLPLSVVVTIKPVHALALQVLNGIATPTLIVSGQASPHSYALKPSDAKLFNAADIVVRVSETLEPFTARIVKSLPKTVQVVTLDRADGIRTLPRRQGATFDKHNHAGHKSHAAHGHAKGAAATTDIDGHLWLDPTNAKAIIAEIAKVTSAKRPAAAAAIAANAAQATARIDALDAELARVLAAAKATPYVVFHDALQYFDRHFGLTPAGSLAVDPDVPPSAKRLTDVRSRIKTLAASCVFAEPGYETRVVQSVIEGTRAKTGVLDPEGLTVAAGPDAYDTLMRGLARALQGCLAPA